MTNLNPIPHTSTVNPRKDAHELLRRGFIKMSVLASGALSFWLSGCTLGEEKDVENGNSFEVIDEWIRTVNAEDVTGFEKLHAESVFWTIYTNREPFSGREQIWDLHRVSTGNQIEKLVAFAQDQSVCLLVNATRFNRSQCYVFNLVDDMIDRVYGYDSRRFNLASSPHFMGIEVSGDDKGLQDRLNALDDMFLDGVNNRDFSEQALTESSLWFNFNSSEPHVGFWETDAEGNVSYVRNFPSVRHRRIQTFGQGNLVCSHIAVSDPPGGSLCFVGDFQDGKIAKLYEFRSNALVNG
jgi:hypothetical protein